MDATFFLFLLCTFHILFYFFVLFLLIVRYVALHEGFLYNFVSNLSECQTFNQHSNTLQFIQEISIIKTVALNMCDIILDMYQYITLLLGEYRTNHLYGGLNSTKLILRI